MRRLLLLVGCCVMAATAVHGQEAYMELLRSDLRAEKVAFLTEAMDLTDEEASKFWPIYREYELELSKIYDARIELVKDYLENHLDLTDEKAKELVERAFKLMDKKLKLKKNYFKKFEKELSSKVAARFLQIENLLDMLIELQIASGIPLVE